MESISSQNLMHSVTQFAKTQSGDLLVTRLHVLHMCYTRVAYVLHFFSKLWSFLAVLCHLAAVEEERGATSEGAPHKNCLVEDLEDLEVALGNTSQLVELCPYSMLYLFHGIQGLQRPMRKFEGI